MIPPPLFPDVAHVANGCYVSAVVYLAKFAGAFPLERGEPAAFVLPNADGEQRSHTLAVISWQGEWWARDEYFGVVALDLPSDRSWDPALAQRRIDAGFRRQAQRLNTRSGRPHREVAPSPRSLTPEWRLAEIMVAQRLLPFPSEIYWLCGGRSAVPFLYFRRNQAGFGVYDPAIGTGAATSTLLDGAILVAAVAQRLGYPASPAAPDGERVAALSAETGRHASRPDTLAATAPARLPEMSQLRPAHRRAEG
jgi:hypothetical protein